MTLKHHLPLLIGLAACPGSRIAPPPSPHGRWTIEMSVTQSPRDSAAVGKRIVGAIRLRPNSGVVDRPAGAFGYFGTFAIDFRPIGGLLTGTSDTSAVVTVCGGNHSPAVAAASAHWDDSVHVTLNPCTDHGRVVLDGVWHGDHVSGRWYESREGGSSGTFTMRHSS